MGLCKNCDDDKTGQKSDYCYLWTRFHLGGQEDIQSCPFFVGDNALQSKEQFSMPPPSLQCRTSAPDKSDLECKQHL